MGDKRYLKLGWEPEGPPIILYQESPNGEPILDKKQIGIIKIRLQGNRATLVVDSNNNYKFLRYRALEKNTEFKKVVDRKIKKLDELNDGKIE